MRARGMRMQAIVDAPKGIIEIHHKTVETHCERGHRGKYCPSAENKKKPKRVENWNWNGNAKWKWKRRYSNRICLGLKRFVKSFAAPRQTLINSVLLISTTEKKQESHRNCCGFEINWRRCPKVCHEIYLASKLFAKLLLKLFVAYFWAAFYNLFLEAYFWKLSTIDFFTS